MAHPLIGVTTSITIRKELERAYVNSAYLAAVQEAGGVPVLLPPQLDGRALSELVASLDGLLLTGGGDLDPARFDEPPHPTLAEVSPARDRLEIILVERFMEARRPILAICRGIQVLNVARGGSLYQDVASDPGTAIQHQQKGPRDQPTHAVEVVSGSLLARTVGSDELEVNSLHHQAVKTVGRGLLPVAFAPDGIVEGVELEDAGSGHFVLGVQWHPEELVAKDPASRRLFGTFVDASRT
ncbi:MAG: gamma-glutamyl-gamma-aminobutyrate hydrolase family protein [Candidatus Rokubacteria bacterium]|nr:gamma-glutamyl-gamma-aminobutyrate hydrolase family protein [Candidatus Rokubacteria bacterium]